MAGPFKYICLNFYQVGTLPVWEVGRIKILHGSLVHLYLLLFCAHKSIFTYKKKKLSLKMILNPPSFPSNPKKNIKHANFYGTAKTAFTVPYCRE